MYNTYQFPGKMIILFCLVAAGGKLAAQDPHFTQYYSSPATLNPAMVGQGVVDWRATGTYRSQWWGGSIAPYTTTSVSIDKSLPSWNSSKSNWGVGLSALSDASNSGLLKNNYFSAGIAYHLDLSGDGKEILGLGMSGSYANRILDAGKFAFQDQFGSMGFQRSVPTADPATLLNNHYWDLNTGITFDKKSDTWGYGVGAAIYHAGTPKEGVYSNSTYSLPGRTVIHGNFFYQLPSGNQIQFSGISEWQANNNIFTIGALYKIQAKSENLKSINVGLWDRFGDAISPYAGLEGKNWLLGLSYDVVSSKVRTSYNSVQSMEISIGWLFGKSGDHRGKGFNY